MMVLYLITFWTYLWTLKLILISLSPCWLNDFIFLSTSPVNNFTLWQYFILLPVFSFTCSCFPLTSQTLNCDVIAKHWSTFTYYHLCSLFITFRSTTFFFHLPIMFRICISYQQHFLTLTTSVLYSWHFSAPLCYTCLVTVLHFSFTYLTLIIQQVLSDTCDRFGIFFFPLCNQRC